jgi:pimeloyl-ACP methyl ester carboxylesterase
MNETLGENWILLRGLARESAHWLDFVPQLQSAFGHARITTLDLPGTGSCHLDYCPWTIGQITDRVRQQALDKGALRQPATVIGLSLGGMISWDWLQRYPEDFCGAVLINTSFANLSPFYQRLNWRNYQRFVPVALARTDYQREMNILQWVCNRRNQDPLVARAFADIQQQRPISLNTVFRQLVAAARFRAGGSIPKQPVLLLNGLGDRLVAPDCSAAIAEQWSLEIRRHPWAGHDLTLDDAVWVIDQLQDWLSANRR